MEQITVANLTDKTHAEAVVDLLNEYAKDEMGGGSELTEFVKQNLVSELQKRPGVHAILAFIDRQPAGLVICMEGFSTFACKPLLNVHDVVVVQKFRGRGLSKSLLAKAEELAVELGCCKLTLEVLEGNSVAQKAYTAAGFVGYELNPRMGKALFWQKKLA